VKLDFHLSHPLTYLFQDGCTLKQTDRLLSVETEQSLIAEWFSNWDQFVPIFWFFQLTLKKITSLLLILHNMHILIGKAHWKTQTVTYCLYWWSCRCHHQRAIPRDTHQKDLISTFAERGVIRAVYRSLAGELGVKLADVISRLLSKRNVSFNYRTGTGTAPGWDH